MEIILIYLHGWSVKKIEYLSPTWIGIRNDADAAIASIYMG